MAVTVEYRSKILRFENWTGSQEMATHFLLSLALFLFSLPGKLTGLFAGPIKWLHGHANDQSNKTTLLVEV